MMRTILQHAWCELRRRKARTLTTVLGYGLAVSSMMVLVGVLQVADRGSAGILDHTGTHFAAFSPADKAVCATCGPYQYAISSQLENEGLVAFGTRANLLPHAFVDRIKRLSSIEDAAPFLLYRFEDPDDAHLYTVGGFDPKNPTVVGTTCCAATDIVKGRFLVASDRGKILLEQAYAQMRRLDVGDEVRIADQAFAVVGIVNPGIRPARADIYMPYSEAERSVAAKVPEFLLSGHADLILVEVKDSSVQDQAIRAVKSLYPDLVVSSYACYKPAARARAINTTALTMLTGAIGIFTVLLAMASQLGVLMERRRELGILKTLGFSNNRIMGQIAIESVTQASLGAVLAGLLVQLLMPWVLLRWLASLKVPVADIRWLSICALAICLSLVGGLLAGLFPALWAARQRPSSLLRNF